MSDIPVAVVWANPKPEEVWRAYIGGKIKVRELNSGTIQVAVGDKEWVSIDG
jgi:hypothetical protein